MLRGHGLSCPDLDGDVADIGVQRALGGDGGDSNDSFSVTAAATGSEVFAETATVGELWAALPEAFELLPESRWRQPLRVVPDEVTTSKLMSWDRVAATVVGLDQEDPDAVLEELKHYPGAAGLALERPQGLPMVTAHTSFGTGVRLYWPNKTPNVAGRAQLLDRVAPVNGDWDERWLRPAVAGAALTSLMTWWGLLFALSMLARYEPAGWAGALDLDSSRWAAPLIELLDVALQRLPELVLEALTTGVVVS